MKSTARILIASSEYNADMLYISGMFVPDAFIAIGINEQWTGLFSSLEIDRARKQSSFDNVELYDKWQKLAKKSDWPNGLASITAAFLNNKQITTIEVPDNFPLSYARQLEALGFTVTPSNGAFFPQRSIKTEVEIKQLRKAEKLTRNAMQHAENWLLACKIGSNDFLYHDNKKVKAKHLRSVIETFLIARGAVPSHTIVACGKQAADPHQEGHGFLRAHQSIIIDIFPRLCSSGYWGDMTRTYVKGKANKKLKAMYKAVKKAQSMALQQVSAGIDGQQLHQQLQDWFAEQGFPTTMRRGKQVGFFHGTGHGVGLDIHETPSISLRKTILQCNQVVTIEPGLYDPDIGGVRLEDMVVVRIQGCENLTNFHCNLELE
ncbi:MAG: Xaa-Pro peptidase family protein [Mariprofundales bacterium]